MKEIVNFINNNAIVASLITLALTTLIQIIFRKSDRKYSEKIDNKKEMRREFENKAELFIDDNIKDDGSIPHINIFMTDFNVEVLKSEDEVKFYYSEDVLNKEKYKHMTFYLKNIGHADINQLDICVTSQRNIMLCDIETIDTIVKNNFVNYNYCFDRKIMQGSFIMIDIAYLENSRICNMFSSELALLFRDSYNNLYEQPFFICQKNLYEPIKISNKDYRIYTTIDTALDCFKNPWLW